MYGTIIVPKTSRIRAQNIIYNHFLGGPLLSSHPVDPTEFFFVSLDSLKSWQISYQKKPECILHLPLPKMTSYFLLLKPFSVTCCIFCGSLHRFGSLWVVCGLHSSNKNDASEIVLSAQMLLVVCLWVLNMCTFWEFSHWVHAVVVVLVYRLEVAVSSSSSNSNIPHRRPQRHRKIPLFFLTCYSSCGGGRNNVTTLLSHQSTIMVER